MSRRGWRRLSLIFGTRHHALGRSARRRARYGVELPDHTTNSWTFSDKKGGEPFHLPRIDRATVTGHNAALSSDPRLRVLADLAVDDIAALDKRIGRAVGLHGGGTLRTTPFRVEARLLSPDATARNGENQLLAARLWAANNVVDVNGTLPSARRGRGRAAAGAGAWPQSSPSCFEIIGVVLPQTRALMRCVGQLVKHGEEYRFTHITGTAGNTDRRGGRLTITNGARLHLDSGDGDTQPRHHRCRALHRL